MVECLRPSRGVACKMRQYVNQRSRLRGIETWYQLEVQSMFYFHYMVLHEQPFYESMEPLKQ